MSTAEEALQLRIARLELEPGDILVVEMREGNDPSAGRIFSHIVPAGVRVMMISKGVNLSVLTKAEIENRLVA